MANKDVSGLKYIKTNRYELRMMQMRMSRVTFDDLHDLSSVAMAIGSPYSLFESSHHYLLIKDVNAQPNCIKFLEILE